MKCEQIRLKIVLEPVGLTNRIIYDLSAESQHW